MIGRPDVDQVEEEVTPARVQLDRLHAAPLADHLGRVVPAKQSAVPAVAMAIVTVAVAVAIRLVDSSPASFSWRL